MPLENVVPQELNRWFGLNSKQSRSKLAPGFSPSSTNFFNMDLSVPGRTKPRGGNVLYAMLKDPANLLTNGSFETWTGLTDILTDGAMEVWTSPTVLTNWTLGGPGATLAQEGMIKKVGTYSAKLTRSGNDCAISQTITSNAYRNKTMILGCWVYATVASRARLMAYDGVTLAYSSYHSGVAGWEFLTVPITCGAAVTSIAAYGYVINGDTSAYFDSAIMYEQLAPTGWTLSGAGATVAREEGTVKVGTYSSKLTRNGTDSYFLQDIQNNGGHNLAYWKGRTITQGMWVRASVANRARLIIRDGGSLAAGYSSYHTGSSTWEYLSVTRLTSSDAAVMNCGVVMDGGDTTAYFDGATVTEDTPYTPTRLFNYYNGSSGVNNMLSSAGNRLFQITTGKVVSVLSSGFTTGWIGDFLNYGTEAFITSPTDTPQIYNGTTLRNWGIVGPVAANTFAANSGTGLTGTYMYKFTYVNSVSGHESNASPASAGQSATNETINLTGLTASADTQVDKINIYRTTAGGAIYFYLAQIANGTTTYADSIADALLGITEAPLQNYPPAKYAGIEEWDGRIWGFLPYSTRISFSNDGYYTPTGTGNPWESFATANFIDFKAQVLGIKKSPNFNELWVHTKNGVYAVVPTYIPQNPYQPVIRNSSWQSAGHLSIANIYNQQWFVTENGKAISLDSAGNIGYESYYIEPDFGNGNTLLYSGLQAVHYRGNNKNQYRCAFPLSGLTSPTVMVAANYLLRTPDDTELGRTFPVWEYHLINSVCMAVCRDSNNQEQLFTGWTDGCVYEQDQGTNDNGAAISWSHSVGWIRAADTAEKTALGRRIVQYYNPLGDWFWNLTTNFDFGNGGGQVYPVKAPPVGGELDVNFYLDLTPLCGADAFVRVVTPFSGSYSYLELVWAGNALDQIMELHGVVILPIQLEGFRDAN